MPKLVLISLKCIKTTFELGDKDAVFINVNGVRVFGVVEIRSGGTAHPGDEINFVNKAVIDVWEHDTGSDNDRIGQHTARRWQKGQGKRRVWLSGDGSDYTLTYEVV